jgi:ParB/RepB/Spo0J family partition protein
MAATTHQPIGVQLLNLDQIALPDNVRELDPDHVANLAGSIELRGLLVPVIVTPGGGGYQLVAGFHRFAAHRQLGLTQIRAEIQAVSATHVDRGVENITRKQLNPYQEAQAVAAMLADGLTDDGAAQALGWPKARVTARMRLLELTEAAQQMMGRGEIPLSAINQLRHIGQVSPEILRLLIDYLADGNQAIARRLAREPGWVLDAVLRSTTATVFEAYLSHVDGREIQTLRLGNKTEALYEHAAGLAKQLDRYSFGPDVRFAEVEIDQARAAVADIEFERSRPIIVDKSLYRELCQAGDRPHRRRARATGRRAREGA